MSFTSCIVFFLQNDVKDELDNYKWHSKTVTATAYNSLKNQTDSNPNITAFGDTLQPGMKCIALSRDLLALGLKHNTPVIIEGFEGVYLVKDKMHSRWKNRIDIYMGVDVDAAKNWGKKKVCIDYGTRVSE
ncbi:MAG: 3D domain-containing protein [Jejuia sp.]